MGDIIGMLGVAVGAALFAFGFYEAVKEDSIIEGAPEIYAGFVCAGISAFILIV